MDKGRVKGRREGKMVKGEMCGGFGYEFDGIR